MESHSQFFYFLVLLAFVSVTGFSQQKTFISTGNDLYDVDLETCTARHIHSTGAVFFDIAYCPSNGKMYGVNERFIYEIDTINNEVHYAMDVPEVNSLTCDVDGFLYSSSEGFLYQHVLPGGYTNILFEANDMISNGDITFYNNDFYLSTKYNGLSRITISSSGGYVSKLYKIDSLVDVFGMFTVFRGCEEDFYVMSLNDIYKLDENLEPQMLCENIVPDPIFGAASTSEPFSSFSVGLDQKYTLCENQVPIEIKLDKPLATYLWNDGSTNRNSYFYNEGKYWVDVTQVDCVKRDTFEIEFQAVPEVDLGEDLTLCEGQEYLLEIPIDNVSFSWQDGSRASTFVVNEPGTYEVEIEVNGCKNSEKINISYEYCAPILEMPNVVTPNSDGKNDFLQPKEMENITSINTKVYNRYGIEIYNSENPDINWSPIDQASGLYYYILQYQDLIGEQFYKKGWVQVLR